MSTAGAGRIGRITVGMMEYETVPFCTQQWVRLRLIASDHAEYEDRFRIATTREESGVLGDCSISPFPDKHQRAANYAEFVSAFDR
jgi:hypothetical protein